MIILLHDSDNDDFLWRMQNMLARLLGWLESDFIQTDQLKPYFHLEWSYNNT